MRNKIIVKAYEIGYSIGRVVRTHKVLRTLKRTLNHIVTKKSSKTKEITLTKQEVLEYCMDCNKYFANTNPELVFNDEQIRHLMSLANN
jgi:hypothetical protein